VTITLDAHIPKGPIADKWTNHKFDLKLVNVAEESGVDVIVVGSHGKGWFKRVVIGSISEYVVHHSHIPVLVIRNEPADGKD